MPKYTKAAWENYLEMEKALRSFAYEFVSHVTNNPRGYGIEQILFEGDTMHIEYDTSCCGHYSTDWESCPIEYLWSDDWKETHIAKEMEKEMRIERERQEQLKLEREEKEREERAEYARLRAKYEENE